GQRGVRAAGPRLRPGAQVRPGEAESERRRDRARTSDRNDGRTDRAHARVRDAREGVRARAGHALHLGRPGRGGGPRTVLVPRHTTREAVMVNAVVLIQCEIDSIAEAAEQIAGIDGVSEVYSVAGEWDLVAIIRVTEHEDLARVIPGGVGKVEGV